MGNNLIQHPHYNNPIFHDWKPHSNFSNVFCNFRTNQQVERHTTVAEGISEQALQKRMRDNSNHIVKLVYYHSLDEATHANQGRRTKSSPLFHIYTERFLPVQNSSWQPIHSTIAVLQGFRRLSSTYGFMRVNANMVGMNQKNQIKVWINSQPHFLDFESSAQTEEQMLADIVQIIMKYDQETGSLLAGCYSIHEGINNIFSNLIDSKGELHYSNRTLKLEEKEKGRKNQQNQSGQAQINNSPNSKNGFRSTKQTEDDFPKPLVSTFIENQSQIIKNQKNSIDTIEVNYLQNVNLPKSPSYIRTFQPDKEIKKHFGSYRNDSGLGVSKKKLNYSEKSQVSPAKLSFEKSNLPRPFQNRRQAQQPPSPAYSSNISPKGHFNHQPRQVFYKPAAYIQKRQIERKKDFDSQSTFRKQGGNTKDLVLHSLIKRSEINTLNNSNDQTSISQEYIRKNVDDKYSATYKNSQILSPSYIDMNRNKTQDFYLHHQNYLRGNTCNFNGSSTPVYHHPSKKYAAEFKRGEVLQTQSSRNQILAFSKRVKTMNEDSEQKSVTKIRQMPIPTVQLQSYKYQLIAPNPTSIKEDEKVESEKDRLEQKKQTRRKMAEQIRKEMGGVLNLSKPEEEQNRQTFNSVKSSKDILIKQRIEDKRKNFAQLKSEAMKLLLD